MNREILLKPVVYLMFFIFFFYNVIEKFHWDYSIWWIDMLVHFLGGFWQGIFFFWFFSMARLPFFRRLIKDLDRQTLWQAFLFVIFIGVSWEAVEFLTNNYIGLEPFSALDTVSDIFFDLSGGAAAILYSLHRIGQIKPNRVQSN